MSKPHPFYKRFSQGRTIPPDHVLRADGELRARVQREMLPQPDTIVYRPAALPPPEPDPWVLETAAAIRKRARARLTAQSRLYHNPLRKAAV